MKITNDTDLSHAQTYRAAVAPMFLPADMEQPMADDNAETQEQEIAVSLFDVKELYDLAYAEKAKGKEGADSFNKILAEAVKLDLAYRRQLAKEASYKDKTKLKNFKVATEGQKTGSRVA